MQVADWPLAEIGYTQWQVHNPLLWNTRSYPVDDEKLNTLHQEVVDLRGRVLRVEAEQHALEARLMALSELLEQREHDASEHDR